MPIDPAAPLFPLHEPLARFFASNMRRRVPISEVAELLGTTTETFRSMLDSEGVNSRSGTLAWPEAAAYLFDAWPRDRILATLGTEHAHRIPALFHPTRVNWSIPIFIVRAMEHQAAADWSRDPRLRHSLTPNHTAARGVQDYVTDLLFSDIQQETLLAFRDDQRFLDAYHYPSRR